MNPTEQSPMPPTEALLPAVATPDSQPDERWDPDKAASMASVLKSDPEFQAALADRHQIVLQKRDPVYLERNLTEQKAKIKEREDEVRWAEKMYHDDGPLAHKDGSDSNLEKHRNNLKHFQDQLATAKQAESELVEAELADDLGQLNAKVDEKLIIPEELFDFNPAVFGAMSKAEFTAASQEYQQSVAELAKNQAGLKALDRVSLSVQNLTEQQIGVDDSDCDNLQQIVSKLIDDPEELSQAETAIQDVLSNRFHKTPAQINASLTNLVAKYHQRAQQAVENSQATKQAIIGKHVT